MGSKPVYCECILWRSFVAFGAHVFFNEERFPLRAEVEGCNNRRLNELTGDIQIYHAMDSRGYNAKGDPIDKEMAQRLLDRLVAPREISLKVTGDGVLAHPLSLADPNPL
jgi:hypothetical protein